MNTGKYIFSQMIEFLPQRVFDGFVAKYEGNKYVKHFSCWNQLLVMMFGQLSNRDNLRGLILVIEAHSQKKFHLGFGKNVTRSNLSEANEERNSKIFEDYAYYLIDIARKRRANNNFEIEGKVYAFDSSTIDLCLYVFWWAKFRTTKAGIKLQTLYDITTQIPTFIHITNATVNDMNAMDVIPYESEAYYIFDRVYVDYKRLYNVTRHTAYFVIRPKKNLQFQYTQMNPVNEKNGVMSDQIGKLTGFYISQFYPDEISKVIYYDKETNRTFVYLTNNMKLTSEQIALLYKKRWQVELFFKWIKQHLKIKSFWGINENAVRIQIYTAVILYCLVAIIESELMIKRSTYEIMQILGISLLDKYPIGELFFNTDRNDVKELSSEQLTLNFFSGHL
ncbi:MAG: IS4 family transposase [Paludibacter sp.]|nr:IS4 family transposase [Paludibacter sp.]